MRSSNFQLHQNCTAHNFSFQSKAQITSFKKTKKIFKQKKPISRKQQIENQVQQLKDEILQSYFQKTCLICKEQRDQKLAICSLCGDAYHRSCLKQLGKIDPQTSSAKWFCFLCIEKDIKQEINQVEEQSGQQGQQFINSTQFNGNLIAHIKNLRNIIYSKKKYLTLTDLGEGAWPRQLRTCFRLKPFTPIENKQAYWQPLLYALSQTNQIYCPYQVYKDQKTMSLNKSIYNKPDMVQRLSKKDEIAFEKFSQLVENGDAPPLGVEKCPIKGFLVRSLEKIEPKTILCEYSGEVMTLRQSLEQTDNDSIFRLLQAGQSRLSLNIVPKKFANISKYFLGINNSMIVNYEKINVQSILFSYKGRNRVIFYSLRNIEKGELLYIDYNGGCKDYPTASFL